MGARFVDTNGLRFAYLEAGPSDGPLALCLHGFPDHALTWRHLLPALADAGFHAVAPWMRGYAPTAIPTDADYRPDALAADADALHDVLGGDERAVIIGHDWGAVAAYRAAWRSPRRWRRVVAMAVPPEAFLARARPTLQQLRRSWYTLFFQLPGAERIVARDDLAFIDRLWAAWSPGYRRQPEDIGPLQATLRSPGVLSAALGYYRAVRREVWARRWPDPGCVPSQPTLYLHGRSDGCMGVEFVAGIDRYLSEGSEVALIDGVGHFLHLEAPETVAARVLAFLT